MNFLQLVQRTKRESGLQGSDPATIAAAIVDNRRVVDWVEDSLRDIETMPREWRWMRIAMLGTATVGVSSYMVFIRYY